ncbi:TIGR02611 family protein [Pilimelia columellifera]|uniref:TIGR02611 family protein n=1 Tax=Pilimelia columellifera subsp. columellifera TaxID=706583 RepID=A0ABP6AY71_9ACTN
MTHSRLMRRLHATLDSIRARPTGRLALKVAIGGLGAAVFLLGLVLIPLPGPGWALVILGMAIWAVEFVWAKHLLGYTRRQVGRWTSWARAQTLPVRLLLGASGLLIVSVALVLSVRFSFGRNLVTEAWIYVTTH